MAPLHNAISNWTKELQHYKPPNWESLPDLDLYMDQVITYLEKQMAIFTHSEDEKIITPPMINNYVKSEVIPRPIQKKYKKEHLAYMIAVLNLKQVLSLSDITKLIAQEITDTPIAVLFDQFNAIQYDALRNASIRVSETLDKLEKTAADSDTEKALSLLALKLALEANANRIAAKRILSEILAHKQTYNNENENEKEKSKNKSKSKSKSKENDTNKNKKP